MKHILIISFLLSIVAGNLRSQDVTLNVVKANGANTGSITAIVNDPIFEYSFEWTDSDGNLIVPQPSCNDFNCTLGNLNPGRYCVRITSSGSECDEDKPSEAHGCVDVEGVSCDKEIDWFVDVSDPVCSNSATGWIQDGSIINNTDLCWNNNGLGFITATRWMDESDNEQENASSLKPGKYCRTVFADEDGSCSDCYLYICAEVPSLDSDPLTVDAWTGNICYSRIVHESEIPLEASWVELVKGYGWIFANSTGGYGNKSIRWLDDDLNNWNRIINTPGVYCAEITDECGISVIKCWEIVILYVDHYCLAPYFSDIYKSQEFKSSVENIHSSWGNFEYNVSVNSNIYFSKLHDELNKVKYSIKHSETEIEIGTLELINGVTSEFRFEEISLENTIPYSTEFKIYPNPNSGLFNVVINSGLKERVLVDIFSIDGKLLLSNSIELSKGHNERSIDVRHLGRGLYLLKIGDKTPIKIIVNN